MREWTNIGSSPTITVPFQRLLFSVTASQTDETWLYNLIRKKIFSLVVGEEFYLRNEFHFSEVYRSCKLHWAACKVNELRRDSC